LGTGVIELVNLFLRHLGNENVARRIAPLQLAGRIEDYLVKEFMQFVFQQSEGRRFCDTNYGLRGEPRVDIAIRRCDSHGREVLEALIEAKYLRNRGHRHGKPHDKFDEIGETLLSLRKQLEFVPGPMQGKTVVRRRSRSVNVYGLVFAGYARREEEDDSSKDFLGRIRKTGNELGLCFHDLPMPYFRKAFRELPLIVFGEKWLISLWGGLWCIRKSG
jgi:hypothetical protein